MRTFAIGDIHGSADALKELVDWIDPREGDRVITLGDYVDRGLKSKEVIDFLLDWPKGIELIRLKGNHELLMSDSLLSEESLDFWLSVGGIETLISYGGEGFENVSDEHWEFINGGQYYHEEEDHIFVHGGVDGKLPMKDQDDLELCWRRDMQEHESGKTVICGHTAQWGGRPLDLGHVICIDTHAHGEDGWLTAMEMETGEYFQTNDELEHRRVELDHDSEDE